MGEFADIAAKYPTDRCEHGYHTVYEELYTDRRDEVDSVLEVGVLKGGGLMTFAEYFPNATVYGMDIDLEQIDCIPDDMLGNRIFLVPGDSVVTKIIGPYSFDLIVDDGAHTGCNQLGTFQNLYQRLRPGGLYVIEDVEPHVPDSYFDQLGVPHEVRDLRAESGKPDSRMVLIRRGGLDYGRI